MADGPGKEQGADRSAASGPRPVLDVIRTARSELAELIGLRPEAVTRFERTGDGWLLEPRSPNSRGSRTPRA